MASPVPEAVRRVAAALLLWALGGAPASAQTPEHIAVYASPSLRGSLADEALAFTALTGVVVDQTYGAGGKLADRIAAGGPVDVFVSGAVDDARRAYESGSYGPVTIPTRTPMCLLVNSALAGTRPALDLLLDPSVRIVTGVVSPPHADPSGDYAEQLFANVDRLRPGSLARLDAKALRYPGPGLSVPAGAEVQSYLLLTSNQADASVLYCASLGTLTAAHPGQLRSLPLPPEIAVTATFGLTVRVAAPPAAERFRDFLSSDRGRAIFVQHGFEDAR